MKKKPTFNEPTPTEWFVKKIKNEEYPDSEEFTVNGKRFVGQDSSGNPFTFQPEIARITFGRNNAERRTNAKLIASAPKMLSVLKEIESIYLDMKKKKIKLGFIQESILMSVKDVIKQSKIKK